MRRISINSLLLLLTLNHSAFADVVTDNAQNKPLTVTEDNNAGYSSSYSREDKNGWAFLSYKVDKTGKLLSFDIINQSDFRDSTERITDYLDNLEFSPAMLDDKNHIGSKNFFYQLQLISWKQQQDQVSKEFFSQYEEIERALRQNKLTEAEQLLADISRNNVKNWVEQSLFYWQKSQLFYKQQDWTNYGNSMQDLFSLSDYLPNPVPALQNLIEWFVYDKDYAMARRSLIRLENLENVVLEEQTKAGYLNFINGPVNQNEPIIIGKSLSTDEIFYRELVRNQAKVEIVSGKLASAELRCANNVVSLGTNKSMLNIDVKNYLKCYLFLAAETDTSFLFSQTGNAI